MKSIKLLFLLALAIPMVAFGQKSQKKTGAKKPVKIGVITYSYRSMPMDLKSIIDYVDDADITSIELMGNIVEDHMGIPHGVPRLKKNATDAEKAAHQKKLDEQKAWRLAQSMDRFVEVRKMFKAEGIDIHILKLGQPTWSDEEIDYAFKAAKAVGAKGISFEISDEAAKRMAPFAAKHKMFAIMHNHMQPGDPNFSFERILSNGEYLRLNFDAGHYFGATGKNPAELIEKLNKKIFSVHIKDKTGPKNAEPNKNREFGKGETPLADVFNVIKKNKYNIYCDIELEYDIPQGSNAKKEVECCVDYCNALIK